MCGIAGFVGPWSETLLSAMVASLAHRGPDGSGAVFDGEAGLAIGHTRLAIIDLTDAASQPMTSADGRYVLTYNGEIYNYRDLRHELAASGETFVSDSDTEVLLRLFARHGLDCVDRLHGIFAFAIWDRATRRLHLARDHLGVKPLYYAALTQGFLFASELKTLSLCADVARDLDPVAVAEHAGFIWSPGEATMLKSVRKLRPGSKMTVDGSELHIRRYYRTPLAGPADRRTRGSAADLADLLDRVVADQMVADVDVGALLSGGVDSSAIVASMSRATEPSRIKTFCAAVTSPVGGADNFGADVVHAREVAQRLGVELVEVPTDAELVDELPGMLWSLDEPCADFAALQTWLLAREARHNGIKVLLSGVGGDDLFTGYGRHVAGMIYALLRGVPGARAVAASVLTRWRPTSVRGRRLHRLGMLLGMEENDMLCEAMTFSSLTARDRVGLMSPGLRGRPSSDGRPEAFARSLASTSGMHPVERLLDLELNGFLPDLNLNYTDKMAMRAGVEIRVPLIDTRMVDFAAQLPIGDRIDPWTTKKILRDSQRFRLPKSVLHRSKQGFGVPVRSWLSGPARPMLEELTAPSVIDQRGLFDATAVTRIKEGFIDGRIDAATNLLSIIGIELWCRALDAAPTAGDREVLQPGVG